MGKCSIIFMHSLRTSRLRTQYLFVFRLKEEGGSHPLPSLLGLAEPVPAAPATDDAAAALAVAFTRFSGTFSSAFSLLVSFASSTFESKLPLSALVMGDGMATLTGRRESGSFVSFPLRATKEIAHQNIVAIHYVVYIFQYV